MSPRIKRIIPIVALLLLCSTLFVSIGGCLKKDDGSFCTDLFYCMYNEDKTGVIILELTGKGQEQEVLVIPEEINGLPVVQLGGETMGYPYSRQHFLKSVATKKMYVPQMVGFGNNDINMGNLSEIIVYPSVMYGDSFRTTFVSKKIDVYVRKGIIGTGYLEDHGFHSSYNDVFKEADVTYYSDIDEICFIDNYSPNNLYIDPIIPKKEGFVFAGWYLEKDCNNLWDGQYFLPDGKETLNLYAKWSEA